MEKLDKVILCNLIVEYDDGKTEKLKMKNANGIIYEDIPISVLDYVLSSYNSLQRCLENLYENHYILSPNAKLKFVSIDGTEYLLPFETNYNDIIYKCSESVIFNGKFKYIINGNENRTVSNTEFHDFFHDFTSNILDEVGYELLTQGYFKDFSSFEVLLKEYYKLSQKEDDMYANAKANRLERDFPSIKYPKTIDDYLRNYSIFREAVAFNLLCDEKRKEKSIIAATHIEDANRVNIHDNFKTVNEKRDPSYYAFKRSLCYIIGNNCEPLILRTMSARDLDHFIMDTYTGPKDIKREFEQQIRAYVYEHKEYVTEIRNSIGNQKYSGQLSILAHDQNGYFIRTSEGAYLRYPIIYESAFKAIKSLYCNIDKFRKQVEEARKNLTKAEYKLVYVQTEKQYGEIKEKFDDVIKTLEEEKKLSQESLEKAKSEIKRIITDMKELEEIDYRKSLANPDYNRIFSQQAADMVRYVAGVIPKPSYKKILDSWFTTISKNSHTDYDEIRIILRELRKKIDIVEYEFPIIDVPDIYKVDRMNSGHINKIQVENEEEIVEKSESFLSEDELKQMYGEIPDDKILKEENIHVYK